MSDEDTIRAIARGAIEEFTILIDDMIAETVRKPRAYPPPLMGGANQVAFDGEEVGKFIRFTILMEVRDRVTGEKHSEREIINLYHIRSAQV